MKKILLMLFCLLTSIGAWAENPVTLTNGDKSITVSSYYTGDVYTLTITSESTLAGLGGSFWFVPGSGNEDVRTHMTQVDENTLKIVVTATEGPQLYTPLYVLMPGEVNFGQITFDWEEDSGTGAASDLTLTSNASLSFDLASATLTSQITYTTSSTGAVTYKSSKESVATVSETGLITAVGVGSATITVAQAEDATYKKGSQTINVTVENSALAIMNFGSAGHFGTPDNKKVFYQFVCSGNEATIYLNSMTGSPLDFAEVHIAGKGNYAMEKDGNGYKKTISVTEGEDLYMRFLYSDESFGGNEMTSENVNSSDPNIIYWKASTTPAAPAVEKDVNFALASNGSTATATSGNAGAAIDGNNGSRWESASNDAEDWVLNMGQRRLFNTIQIRWEGAYTKTFDLLVSEDGQQWAVVKQMDRTLAAPGNYEENIDLGFEIAAQYVKFHGIQRATGWGNSFYEFRVLNPDNSVLTTVTATAASAITKVATGNNITVVTKDQNGKNVDATITYTVSPADAGAVVGNVYTPAKAGSATITAHASYDGVELDAASFDVYAYVGDNVAQAAVERTKVIAQSDFAPNGTNAAYAVDGNAGSVWQGSATNGTEDDEASRTYDSWFVLDLGANYDIELVTINFEGACSQDYTVQVSNDNINWDVAYTYSMAAAVYGHTDMLYPGTTQQHVTDNEANLDGVRYVKFYSTKAATQWGMKMFEFQVFGTPAPVNVTVSAEGWATYYNANAYTMPEGLEGYIMKDVEGTIMPVLTYEATDVVPAETALLLKNAGDYTLVPATGGTAPEGNLLKGNLVEGPTVGGGAGAKYYKLANGENGLGWYWGANDGEGGAFTIGANKAYLVVEGPAASNRFISLGDYQTAIEAIKVNADNVLFDLQGRRVKNAANGMYIVNGKKVLR